ncbi:MAG: hypothetical protein ABIG96_06055 [Candidatus Micrarchaeota archaeon]
MADWSGLLHDEGAILASRGSVEVEGNTSICQLVLTDRRIYIIVSRGLIASVPVVIAEIPLEKLKDARITGKMVRCLQMDYLKKNLVKRIKFTSFDFEVRELLEIIEEHADNLG